VLGGRRPPFNATTPTVRTAQRGYLPRAGRFADNGRVFSD